MTTTEATGTAQFTIVLDTQPSNDVSIDLSSDDTSEGTISPAQVIYNSSNWNVAQTVTLTGVNDDIDDGNVTYNAVTAAAVSSDGNYNGINADEVNATNTDDDTYGISVGAISGPTTETGGTATFTIELDSEPTDPVTIRSQAGAQATRRRRRRSRGEQDRRHRRPRPQLSRA